MAMGSLNTQSATLLESRFSYSTPASFYTWKGDARGDNSFAIKAYPTTQLAGERRFDRCIQ